MAIIVLMFSSATTASYLVAGIPAAARAAHEIARVSGRTAPFERCLIAVPGGWTPNAWCIAELRRLAPDLAWIIVDANLTGSLPNALYVRGEALVSADAIAAALSDLGAGRSAQGIIGANRDDSAAQDVADLKKAGDAILLATGKPSDGIVSRTINRPISRAISRVLLRIPGVVPLHGTIGTALLGIAMATCLFLGGKTGLIWGALLFQAASIFDGVDGEIARSTFRTSAAGAMLDSITDACTNLAFIAGLTANLWVQGHESAAAAGVAALVLLPIGLFLIGQRARTQGGPFTFDVVKNHFRAKRAPVFQWITWITMRDFYAAAMAAMIVIGFAPQVLIMFAVMTTGWLVVILSVLLRTRVSAA